MHPTRRPPLISITCLFLCVFVCVCDCNQSRATQAIEHALLETTKGFYEHTIYDDQVILMMQSYLHMCISIHAWRGVCFKVSKSGRGRARGP
jgi:hypothetical protein